MKRILLTGANGFIGRHCIGPLRRRGFEVHAVTTAEGAAAGEDVVWYKADLLDAAQLTDLFARIRPTHCLHLAWCTEPAKYRTAPENLDWLRSGIALGQAFAKAGGRRLVVAGTCAEYDWRHGWCVESVTPCAPDTLYAASKHALHIALAEFARSTRIGLAWARLFWLYGPHEHPERLVASVARSLLRGAPADCSEGRQMRDYLHVADAGDALAALASSEFAGTVNVASGTPVAVRDVARAVGAATGRSDLLRFGTHSETTEPPLVAADTTRLNRELGWLPKYTLDEGVKDAVAWWRRKLSSTVGAERDR
ncbi:MAG TPA: NAD(P)-dependent oxidoreductase [Burkholderiales bacterium]|nr:NAD(P)-dependent oxidoreductase [Burkholderiales bacterium]